MFVHIVQWIFIIKEFTNGKDTSYLLARKNEINFKNAEGIVLGWVDARFITKWASSVCLEPNTDAEAISERQSYSIKASIFHTEEGAVEYFSGRKSGNPDWDDDQYATKFDPSFKRFPILKNNNDMNNNNNNNNKNNNNNNNKFNNNYNIINNNNNTNKFNKNNNNNYLKQ